MDEPDEDYEDWAPKPPRSYDATPAPPRNAPEHHPEVDFEHWAAKFPLESFYDATKKPHFDSTEPGDPIDRRKPSGTWVVSPPHLCEMELVRRDVASRHDLGPAVPVDVFLWSIEPPKHPYLTKLGGVPHREASKPWPTNGQGEPLAFVAQFCFLDSRDVISDRLPGDVMLVFFDGPDAAMGGDVRIEWSAVNLARPLDAKDCPTPTFPVPQVSGVIHRTFAYPESRETFRNEGHYQFWLFPSLQATTIGRETYYIQHDPREERQELLCSLTSLFPSETQPFVDLETRPDDWDQPEVDYWWGKYRMLIGDVGNMYFLIDADGEVTYEVDCY